MRVLIVYGTKMGSTREIAQEIGRTLRGEGLDVDVQEASRAAGSGGYDAVIVGSALYMARWRPEVVRFLNRERRDLGPKPVWLFHDGPLDHELRHAEQPLPKKVSEITSQIGVREAVTFGGRLDEHPKGFVAKKMAARMSGDFRDWDQIKSWAQKIASELRTESDEATPRTSRGRHSQVR